MAITLNCPRCDVRLSAPDNVVGQYMICGKCKGRVWVPRPTEGSTHASQTPATDGAGAATPAGGGASAPDPMAPVVPGEQESTGPVEGSPPTPPPPAGAEGAPGVPAPNPPPPPATVTPPGKQVTDPQAAATAGAGGKGGLVKSRRRVAKFITADVARSRLEPAADGQLPELTLVEHDDGRRKKRVGTPATQWGWLLLISASLILTVFTLMMDVGDNGTNNSRPDESARNRVKRAYLGDEDEPLQPYQRYLRESQLAHSRGDIATERLYYRRVLRLLRAEHHEHDTEREGVTGQRYESPNDRSLRSDQELERLLTILLKTK